MGNREIYRRLVSEIARIDSLKNKSGGEIITYSEYQAKSLLEVLSAASEYLYDEILEEDEFGASEALE